jgi:hypothetical protein
VPSYDMKLQRYILNYLEVRSAANRTTISDTIRDIAGLQPRGLRPGVRKGYLRGIEGAKISRYRRQM